jgi:hypothetical protein
MHLDAIRAIKTKLDNKEMVCTSFKSISQPKTSATKKILEQLGSRRHIPQSKT